MVNVWSRFDIDECFLLPHLDLEPANHLQLCEGSILEKLLVFLNPPLPANEDFFSSTKVLLLHLKTMAPKSLQKKFPRSPLQSLYRVLDSAPQYHQKPKAHRHLALCKMHPRETLMKLRPRRDLRALLLQQQKKHHLNL